MVHPPPPRPTLSVPLRPVIFFVTWLVPVLLQVRRVCRWFGSVSPRVVSAWVGSVTSRDGEEYNSFQEGAIPVWEGQGWGSGVSWWTEHAQSLRWFLWGKLLFWLTGLGMNGLCTPVFTQYIRSKWKVCAAAKSRKWWLCVTFRGEDALKQTLAPRELSMRCWPGASQNIWSTRSTQCHRF